jgi:hypothetical protein
MPEIIATYVIATFTVPERIGVDPKSMLLLLPLVASIAVVYKATKLPKIKPLHFLKESAILFGSIVVFMAVTALVLCIIAWVITE